MFQTDSEFEDEVRRIARMIWPAAEFGGAAVEEGRERDGIFETDDVVHLVECTVSRQKAKAFEDGNKLAGLVRRYGASRPSKVVQGWFVTLGEPTADQREVIKKLKGRIFAVSFEQFRSKLVDGRGYITARKNYAFGSLRDPQSGRAVFAFDYVPLELLGPGGTVRTVRDISDELLAGQSVVLHGDYGAGKSATSRELFLDLARRYWENKTLRLPILLNLRDHHGQSDPVEALERHARRVGLANPSGLVRAWRAGHAVLLLDGFDEIAAAGWASRTRQLRDLRYRSMELLREFVKQTPRGIGTLLAGRASFFDNPREMEVSLSLHSGFTLVNISEFTEVQVRHYLASVGWNDSVPEWLPARPLLLAYLAHSGLLQAALSERLAVGPAAGWDNLIDRICVREAEIEAGIDPGTIRKLIEALGTTARSSVDGLGPLSPDQVLDAFRAVCGGAPDDRGAVLLQRLPGLGGHHSEDGARVFLDSDFAEVARAGGVFGYIEDPYTRALSPDTWQCSLVQLGAELCAHRCRVARHTPGKISAAIAAAASRTK